MAMHILVTNDDGIDAPGIRALWETLAAIAQVTVIAPDSERSATSQAITVQQPIRVDKYEIANEQITAWRIGGTPTDCVKIALEAIMPEPPDLVISGVNNGSNLGTDVLYSGTVSAAIEGALHGIPSIAVSLDTGEDRDFAPAARIAKQLIAKIMYHRLPPDTLLNVNVPALGEEQLGKMVVTKLGVRQYVNTFDQRLDPRGRTYYWMSGTVAKTENDPDSDIVAVSKGNVSVTPIHFDLTNFNIIQLLKEWNL